MKGEFIKNIYVINSNEFLFHELSIEQKSWIYATKNIERINDLRNILISKYGNNVMCKIKIYIPEQKLEVCDLVTDFYLNFFKLGFKFRRNTYYLSL